MASSSYLPATSLRRLVSVWQPAPSSQFDMQLLTDTSLPLLLYADLDLLRDDLHDCGLFSLNVKIRVMPSFWYILLKQACRVDGVMGDVRETRFFHKFGEDEIHKETKVWKIGDATIENSLHSEERTRDMAGHSHVDLDAITRTDPPSCHTFHALSLSSIMNTMEHMEHEDDSYGLPGLRRQIT